jgi:hypothetical protein
LRFRLRVCENDCDLCCRKATLQLREQVLRSVDASSQRVYLIVTAHGAAKIGLHCVDTSRKCISAVREHLVVSLCLAVRDLHTQDVTLSGHV